MELDEQLRQERDELKRLEREKEEALQQNNQIKASELTEEIKQSQQYIETLEQQQGLIEEHQPKEGQYEKLEQDQEFETDGSMKHGDAELTGVVTDRKVKTTYERGNKKSFGRSSIYDLADGMGYKKNTTITTEKVFLDNQGLEDLKSGVKRVDELGKEAPKVDYLDQHYKEMDKSRQEREAVDKKAANDLMGFVQGAPAERGYIQQNHAQQQGAELSGSFGPASDYQPKPQEYQSDATLTGSFGNQPEPSRPQEYQSDATLSGSFGNQRQQEAQATHEPPQPKAEREAKQEAGQGIEIDGQHFREMEAGNRVNGEIVDTVEIDGSKFYAVEAVTHNRETDRVLVPANENEHKVGDRISATMQADQVSTRQPEAHDLTR